MNVATDSITAGKGGGTSKCLPGAGQPGALPAGYRIGTHPERKHQMEYGAGSTSRPYAQRARISTLPSALRSTATGRMPGSRSSSCSVLSLANTPETCRAATCCPWMRIAWPR